MKVASESFTVVPHPADGEISLLIGGLKIVLDLDEARALTAQLISGMKAICRIERVGDRIARTTPDLAVIEPPLGASVAAPALGAPMAQPAPSPSAGAEAAATAPTFAPLKESSAKEPASKDAAPRDSGLRDSAKQPSGGGNGKADAPAAAARQAADEAAEERDKKTGKKLRSLFKALVKEDDNSFSGGL
ncbi:MAG: hypothetical protein JO255_22515 [Alphaproteobacteria bacterium]|nr:hypothetical protein [Alphaproteobacteria bacterium]